MNPDIQEFIRVRSLIPPHDPVQTSWCVVTGAPGAGKSTVINELERRGYTVTPELARDYMKRKLSDRPSLVHVLADQLEFQRQLVMGLVQIEDELAHDLTVFFDRALPDAIGYYRAAGFDPQELLPLFTIHRYKRIFFLERLSPDLMEHDELRYESEGQIPRLEECIKAGYRDLGYNNIIVPVMPATKRVDYILQNM